MFRHEFWGTGSLFRLGQPKGEPFPKAVAKGFLFIYCSYSDVKD